MSTKSYFAPAVLATNLAKAFEEVGATPQEIDKIYRDDELIRGCLGLFRGTHEFRLVRHIIDCDADPVCPDGWEVFEHKKGGQFEWDFERVKFYLSEKQKSGCIVGNELREELADKPVLNANVLDYLLAHQELIPEEWKGKFIFFWGTIYRDSGGGFVVRCLYWDGSEWDWSYDWLDGDFGSDALAALRAS